MTKRPDDVEILKAHLSEDPSEEFLNAIAATLVEEMADSFPELSYKNEDLDSLLEKFREMKLDEVKSTNQYGRKLDYIQEYLFEEVGVESTDDLTSEIVEGYRKWRKYESLDREKPLSDNTLNDDMYLFRDFIRYLVEHRMVPARFERVLNIPKVALEKGEGVDEKLLTPEFANEILLYLRKYRYAGIEHVVMELFCDTAGRKSGLRSLDECDFDANEKTLNFKHRKKTQLKNGKNSEREITLHRPVVEIIEDYLRDRRPDTIDTNGRNPLLTKGEGRISLSMLQKISYKWTRPCAIGNECPHEKTPTACEASKKNNSAYKCPSSRAPHHIRSGYITDQRNRGISSDAIDHRCDVTPRVQDLHYDLPNDTEKRERYEDEFDIDEKNSSGYA